MLRFKSVSRSLVVLIALCSLMMACSKGGDDKAEGDKGPKGTDAMTLFAGAKPTLPKVFADAGFTWGTLKDDAAKIEGWEHKPVISSQKDNATFSPALTLRAGRGAPDEGVDRLRVVFPKDAKSLEELKAALEKNWGAPMKAKNLTYGEVDIWFNPEAGIKATLHKDEWIGGAAVSYTRYGSLEGLLGTDKAKMGFEGDTPLLGISKEDYMTKYDAWIHPAAKAAGAPGALVLPATEYQNREVMVGATFSGGKLTQYNFDLRTDGTPAGKAPLEAALKKKYGEPTADGENMVYNADPKVTVGKGLGESIKITVEPAPAPPATPPADGTTPPTEPAPTTP